jgi:hypothetical protein
MKPWIVIPGVLAIMAFVMYAAVRMDCARIADDYDEQVRLVDAELQRLEVRYLKLLKVSPQAQAELDPSSEYAAARTADERHQAFRRLTEMHPASGGGPSTSDDAAGAFNRWQILDREYQARAEERDAYMHSWRGKIAKQ